MSNNELRHFGVLGMKWGIRRYQNKDGSLTPAGIKRYGKGGSYRYTSHNTKRLIDKSKNARINGASGYAKEYERKANASQKFDDEYSNYAKKTSVGKAIVGNLLMGNYAYKTYAMARTAGYSRGQSAVKAILDIGVRIPYTPIGESVQRSKIRNSYIDAENGRNSSNTKRIQRDMKNLSDQEFVNKYSTSKQKVQSRIDRYGNPSNSPLAKLGSSNSAKKLEERMMTRKSYESVKPKTRDTSKRSSGPSINVQALLNGYKPKGGSPNSLFDIDDLDLIDINIDDAEFRKEYGISEADYKRYKNA